MGTIKIIGFDEQGQAQRLKIRIARILDYDPVTSTEKENIRDSLGVDDSLSGTFTTPLSVTSASDSSFTGGGKVGLGLSTPLELLHLNASGGGANNRVLSRSHYGSQYADHALVLGYCAKADTTASPQMVVTENSGTGATGNPAAIRMKTGAIEFHTANAGTSGAAFSSQRWAINSTGNLVASSGVGIDFGATSDGSGTMSSELLDDYEEGTWSPVFAMTGGDFTTAPTMDIVAARYVKVGHMVTFYAYLRTDSVDITGAGGSLAVEGLPYANAGSNNYAAINVGQANFWTNAPSGGYVYSGGDYIVLTKRNTGITGSMTEMQAADLTAGVTANQNQLMISGSYFSF